MALIKCSECGKEISDKAEVCINCGYPINKNNDINENILEEESNNQNIINVEGKDIDITQVINLVRQKEKIKAIKLLRKISNLSLTNAKKFIDSIDNCSIIQNDKSSELTCPYCGSTQIQVVKRKWSIMPGFLTNKVDRVCTNCKHKF